MKKLLFSLLLIIFLQNGYSQAIAISTKVNNLRANDFEQLLKNTENPQLIDIRTPREYQMGHIAGAININYYDPSFKENIMKAGLNKNKPVFIYCRSGNRSSRSLAIFKSLGFKKINHLVYGINDWYRNGFPLIK